MFQSSLDFICFTAKKRTPLLNSIIAVWISILLAVALCLSEICLQKLPNTFHSVSDQINWVYTEAVQKKPVVWHYDASDTAYPLLGDVAKAGVKPLLGKPAVANIAIRRIPRITGSGLTRVESHLDDVLKNQFSDLPRPVALQFQVGERSMLKRLQSGMTSPRDIEFYMHELKESARFRATGSLMDAHNVALKWRGVTSKDLFHPDVISKHPEIFGKGW